MGMPNYGYDWKVPYQKDTMARSISNQQAIALAQKYYAAIRFDEVRTVPMVSVCGRGRTGARGVV